MWQCSYCPFTSSRKWNTQVHEKRKHQDQISTSNGNEQRKTNEYYPVQGGETPIVYQQHVQEQQTGDYQPVQAQQGWTQQQGGRVQVLYQQHDRKHAQVNNQEDQHPGERHPLDAVHHQPVQAQQAWAQQQGGRFRVLCQKHNHKHAQVNNQPQYKCYM
jgi:hypothetical protein